MCYYKKVMGLEEKENNEDKSHNEVIEVNLVKLEQSPQFHLIVSNDHVVEDK
jgi:hypothetical protein